MRCKHAIWSLLWLCGGCNGREEPRQVSEDRYLDRQQCWNGSDEFVEGFLIIRQNSAGEYFPRTLSAYCYTANDLSLVLGPEFRITGDNGSLMRRGIIDGPLQTNLVTDQMPASKLKRIIAFRARLLPVPQPKGLPNAYALGDFLFAVDTGLLENDLENLGPIGRMNSFQRVTEH
jgi:hypothetical protein